MALSCFGWGCWLRSSLFCSLCNLYNSALRLFSTQESSPLWHALCFFAKSCPMCPVWSTKCSLWTLSLVLSDKIHRTKMQNKNAMHFHLSSPKLATSICTVRYSFTVLNLGLGQTLHHSLEGTSVTIQVSMSKSAQWAHKSCSRLFMFAKVQLLKSYGFPSCPYEYSYLSCSIFPTKRFRAQKSRFSVSLSYSLSKKKNFAVDFWRSE